MRRIPAACRTWGIDREINREFVESEVGARLIEFAESTYNSPVWTLTAAFTVLLNERARTFEDVERIYRSYRYVPNMGSKTRRMIGLIFGQVEHEVTSDRYLLIS